MRLLHFVQQDDRVWCPLHALGELSAFFIAHVTRRRTDQLRDRVLLHELGHIEADQRLFAAEHEVGQGARDFGLAHARRTEEQERADGPVRTLQAGTAAANGSGQRQNSFVLRDDPFVQLFFDAQQFLRLFFFNGSDGHAGPARYHVLDVLPTDNASGGFIEVVFFAKGAQVLALLAFLVRVEARLLELVVRDGVFHAVYDELDPLLDFGDLLGQRSLAQLYACPSFVNQINRLVRQEAVWDVTVRMRHREVDRIVGVSDGVKLLVPVFDPEQNFGGVDFVRRRNFYRLESSLQRAIFFDGLAILARRGGADALDLSA